MGQDQTILAPSTGWILLAFFCVLWIALGARWGKKAKSLDGFMLAGRNLGLAFGAATAMATWVTSNTIMLAPQFALKMGIWGMLAYATASFGLFLFAPMAARIRDLMPSGYTSGDFIRLRFGNVAWRIFLSISIIYSMAWLVSMGMAGGIALKALAGIPYAYGMSAILAVCVAYTLIGGMYAVIGTDFAQSVIILIGVVAIGVVTLGKVDIGEAYQRIRDTQPGLLDAMMPVALLALFNNMFFGFGEVFHNNVWWSRAFAIRRAKVSKAFLLAGLFWLPIPIAAGFIALFSSSLGINVTDIDMVGPMVAGNLLGPAGAMLVFVVVFCSLGSSIDSLLAATSDLVAEDIYKKMIDPAITEERLRVVSTWIILALGAVTWLICLPRPGGLLAALFLSGPLVGSAIFPVIGGLYWRNASGNAAVAAMLSGSALGLAAYYLLGWFTASLVATAVSMTVMLAAVWLFPKPFEWRALDENCNEAATT